MAKMPTSSPQSASYNPASDLSRRDAPGRNVTLTDPAPDGYDMAKESIADMPLRDPKVESMPISFEAAERGTGR